MESIKNISILGGTGALGTGIAKRLLLVGHNVSIGSRKLEAAEIAAKNLDKKCKGYINKDAALNGEIVILTVPFAHHQSIIEECYTELQGKIFVDATVPLVPPKVGTVQLPDSHSACINAQLILGENVKVVSAFQNISAELLKSDEKIDCDILVCGNNKDSRQEVISLIEGMGMKGWHAGQLANSTAAESLTSVLISINRHHSIDHSGIKITGIEKR